MSIKSKIFIVFLVSQTLFVRGQGIKLSFSEKKDTSKYIDFRCHTGISISKMDALVVWGERQFRLSELERYFYNVSDIDTINVSKEGSNEAIEFGDSGKYGVIFIFSNSEIGWESSNRLLRKYGKGKARPNREVLIVVDGKMLSPEFEYYFAEKVINKISFEDNINMQFDNKGYKKGLFITTIIKK